MMPSSLVEVLLYF